jgi:heme exporter protein B
MSAAATLADARLIAAKDLRVEARSRVALGHVLPFVGAVLLLFAFALDPDTGVLRRATSGLFWVTVLFAAVLIVQRSFALEQADGVLDALRLSGLRPAGMYLGKVAALVVQLLAVEILLGLGVVVFYGVEPSGIALLAVVSIVATVGIAAAGALYGPLTSGLRARDTALPLLLLPVLAPVLLGATRAFEVALGRGVGSGWPWAGMLGIFAVVELMLGTLLWGPLLEET